MTLTDEEKADRKRERMLQTAKQYSIGTYMRKVATTYQKMVRAEAGAHPENTPFAVVNGKIIGVLREVGQCVCVTCGQVGPWTGNYFGGGVIETGHFIASRCASILFEPTNSHPQCKFCNHHLDGNQAAYEQWMKLVYGQGEVDRLRKLRHEVRHFDREELVDMKLEFQKRLKIAEEQMKG